MSLQKTTYVILESYYSVPGSTPCYNPNIHITTETLSLSRGVSKTGSDKGAEEAGSSQATSISQEPCLTSMSIPLLDGMSH